MTSSTIARQKAGTVKRPVCNILRECLLERMFTSLVERHYDVENADFISHEESENKLRAN